MLQSYIDRYFLDLREPREPDGWYHPSTLTGCDRQALYERMGTEKTDDPDIRNIRIMARGTEMHDLVQHILTIEVPGFLPEVAVEWGRVVGSCDGLLPVDEIDGETVYEVQEFKSIGPLGKRYKGGMPKPEHIMQARIYAAGLQDMDYRLSGIRISYFDRDDWSVNEYEFATWTEDEVQDFLAHLDSLDAHMDDGTLPPRKDEGYWLCRYCPFRTRCWNQDGETTLND